ncbi:MAG: impB/mucB/samB family protein [Alphaproteobacteria bacterium]|nr:impB/mucB/samB family protein [Alphaproteobacteria bacterium]
MLFQNSIHNSLTLRWLYIDFNSYFASVEQQLNPELRDRPVVVVPVETDSTSAIAASYEAKAFGIKTNTRIYDAKRICPNLVCVLAQHERYVEFHHRIIEEVNCHLPVTMVCSIDEVACRLMDNETSMKRSIEIAQSIKQGLAKNVGKYIRCSIGIAPNRYLAKVATDLQKPDGLTILPIEDLPQRLLNIQLRDLPGIGFNMEQRLYNADVKNFSTLWNLDRKSMRKIWGSIWGEKMWYFLRGYELPEDEIKRHSLSHSHVMAPDLRDPSKAKFVARRLLLKAASRLRRMGYYACGFGLAVRLEAGLRIEKNMRCYRAQDSLTFLNMLDHLWKKIIQESKNERIKKISLVVYDLIDEQKLKTELFKEWPDVNLKQRHKGEKISKALDKINHRFGRDSILIGMLPSQGKSFSGSKIAFTRIPDREEFQE